MNLSEVKHLPKVDHTPAELDDASRVLLGAANIIESRGLAKLRRVGLDGNSMCVYGAILAAQGVPRAHIDWSTVCGAGLEAIRRLERVVGQAEGMAEGWGAADWNNAKERTQTEVVAKLRAVALMPRG